MKERGYAYSLDDGKTWAAGFVSEAAARSAAEDACRGRADWDSEIPTEILVAKMCTRDHIRVSVTAKIELKFGCRRHLTTDEG